MLDSGLERRFRVGGAERVFDETTSTATVVLPRVETPEDARRSATEYTSTQSDTKCTNTSDSNSLFVLAPAPMLVRHDVDGFVAQLRSDHVITTPSGSDEMLAQLLLLAPLHHRRRTQFLKRKRIWKLKGGLDGIRLTHLEVCVLLNIVCSHSIQNELGFVRHFDDVFASCVRQQPAITTSFKLRRI